jgi:hypothetical protein
MCTCPQTELTPTPEVHNGLINASSFPPPGGSSHKWTFQRTTDADLVCNAPGSKASGRAADLSEQAPQRGTQED